MLTAEAPLTLTEEKSWSRAQGRWFLEKVSVEGDDVKETWTDTFQCQGITKEAPWVLCFTKKWPMQSQGQTLRELRITPDRITEIWDRPISPAESLFVQNTQGEFVRAP